MNKLINSNYKISQLAKFAVPSILGILTFLVPFSTNDGATVLITQLAFMLKTQLSPWIHHFLFSFLLISVVITSITKLFQPTIIINSKFLSSLFDISYFNFLLKTIGFFFITCIALNIGPQFINSDKTGQLIVNNLLANLFFIFLFASFLLPLLTNFGLLELISIMTQKIMRPLFKLPRTATLNCLVSWLGDGTIGVLMTSQQYKNKLYTQKEASIICTNFSLVSITFSILIASQLQLSYRFFEFYLTICITCLLLAIITPRLPPLRHKRQLYTDNSKPLKYEQIEKLNIKDAIENAIVAANNPNNHPKALIKKGVQNFLDIVIGTIPIIMAVGTTALILAEYTNLFSYLGKPFVPILEALQIPDAKLASTAILIGFTDMFIPSILIMSTEHEITRFIIGALSLVQLIYLSEIGSLIISSQLPLTLFELLLIFIIRTSIGLPIITALAHMIY